MAYCTDPSSLQFLIHSKSYPAHEMLSIGIFFNILANFLPVRQILRPQKLIPSLQRNGSIDKSQNICRNSTRVDLSIPHKSETN